MPDTLTYNSWRLTHDLVLEERAANYKREAEHLLSRQCGDELRTALAEHLAEMASSGTALGLHLTDSDKIGARRRLADDMRLAASRIVDPELIETVPGHEAQRLASRIHKIVEWTDQLDSAEHSDRVFSSTEDLMHVMPARTFEKKLATRIATLMEHAK